ncbi:hypothetical protein BGX26_006989 [Mortierella sp. AD094]|nr:hypothetical protein BGX26_006989 [Mortierella sp. AD094]
MHYHQPLPILFLEEKPVELGWDFAIKLQDVKATNRINPIDANRMLMQRALVEKASITKKQTRLVAYGIVTDATSWYFQKCIFLLTGDSALIPTFYTSTVETIRFMDEDRLKGDATNLFDKLLWVINGML